MGLIAGGVLVDTNSEGVTSGSFFSDWPYALPNLLCALINFIALVGVVIWTKETLQKDLLEPLRIQSQPREKLSKDPQVRLVVGLYSMSTFIKTAFTELVPL